MADAVGCALCRDAMQRMSECGCDAYRSMVYETPNFVDYFRAITPEQELKLLNFGSRPSKRKAGGIETLRAIPWMFAWTQTRLHMPVRLLASVCVCVRACVRVYARCGCKRLHTCMCKDLHVGFAPRHGLSAWLAFSLKALSSNV